MNFLRLPETIFGFLIGLFMLSALAVPIILYAAWDLAKGINRLGIDESFRKNMAAGRHSYHLVRMNLAARKAVQDKDS